MKSQSNEQISESYSTKESEKIYPFCISLVSSSLKELQNEWNKKINNNKSKKNIIQLLFSLLDYQILLIQQISKYYNLYIYNLDEDNIKLIKQTININKELMTKKIKTIVNYNSNEKNNNCKINEGKILNYKISKYNENKNKFLQIKDNNTNYLKDSSFRENKNKMKKIKIKNTSKNNMDCGSKNKLNKILQLKEDKNSKYKEEIKNNSILFTKNITSQFNKNKLNLNNIEINNFKSSTHKLEKKQEQLKRSHTEKYKLLCLSSPYHKKKILESQKNNRIKINLAEKFLKNNENSEFATLSNISRHSKKSINNMLCLTQYNFNNKNKENINTLPVEENPVRKVKNIILNAKNSNLLFIKTNTPTNISILNRQRHTTYNTNRNYLLSDDLNLDYDKNLNNIVKNRRKIFSFSNLTKNFYQIKNSNNNEIKKSMSNKYFFNIQIENKNNNKDFKIESINIKVKNKDRKSHQILKDGMKNIEKRLNSKSKDKKGIYKNKSNDCLILIKKMANNLNVNSKKINNNF